MGIPQSDFFEFGLHVDSKAMIFWCFLRGKTAKSLKNGGQGRNRTADASLFRAALYRLSYLATCVRFYLSASVPVNSTGQLV